VFILDLGDSQASKKQLITTLKGIGYSSRKQARQKRNKIRFRDD
jgi:adenylosuccinate synthase